MISIIYMKRWDIVLSLVFLLANVQIAYASQEPSQKPLFNKEDLFEDLSDLGQEDLLASFPDWYQTYLKYIPENRWDERDSETLRTIEKKETREKKMALYIQQLKQRPREARDNKVAVPQSKRRTSVTTTANERTIDSKSRERVFSSVSVARDFSASNEELSRAQVSKNYTQSGGLVGDTLSIMAYDMAVVGVQISVALCCANILYNYAEKGYNKCCAYIARLRNKKNKDKASVRQKDGMNRGKANSKLMVNSLCNHNPL